MKYCEISYAEEGILDLIYYINASNRRGIDQSPSHLEGDSSPVVGL